jgi:hemoglobin
VSESIYDHMGGGEALRRLMHIFYGKVRLDPELQPLFAAMPDGHPDHVALWLGEVFGGPADYTATRGGYPNMVLAHINRDISEAQRARWAELLYASLDEAGMPDDERFRDTFRSYVEWGTRIAQRNSQIGFTPPRQAHVPAWPWSREPAGG